MAEGREVRIRRLNAENSSQVAKMTAFAVAGTTKELDQLLEAFTRTGYGGESLVTLAYLEATSRMRALTQGEEEMRARIAAAKEEGAKLPPIGGGFDNFREAMRDATSFEPPKKWTPDQDGG